MTLYRTESGIVVRPNGPAKTINGRERLPCVRHETGGWHGWLRLDHLTEIKEKGHMANNYVLFSEELTGLNDADVKWIEDNILYYARSEEALDMYGAGFDFEWADTNTGKSVVFYSEDSGSVDAVIELVAKFAKERRSANPNFRWKIEWACTCSKPRVGEFGGGAAVVSPAGIKYIETSQWIDAQLKEAYKFQDNGETNVEKKT